MYHLQNLIFDIEIINMDHPILQRAKLLMSQGRFAEAEQQVENFLEEYPTSEMGRYLLSYIYFYQGKSKDAQKIVLQLQQEDPENPAFLALLTEIDIKEVAYEDAEQKSDFLLRMDPEEVQFYNLKSRIKFAQNYYDSALRYTNQALSIDPENLEALNQKTLLSGMLGDKNAAKNTINEALERNPEDPYTIANHGMQLLGEGKVKEALNRFSEALRINPTNAMARYGMQEGLKNKFFIYRLFFQYFNLMRRLTANGSWAFIIGTYILYRFISKMAVTMPYLKPLVYLILAFFVLSWIINPLMNLYLMSNRYGRLLLDDDDKKMAMYTGGSFIAAILAFILYFTIGGEKNLMAGIFFTGMMIPLGSFLTPYKEKQKKTFTLYTIGIFILGLLGLILSINALFTGALIGIFIYQFALNSVAINSSARKIE